MRTTASSHPRCGWPAPQRGIPPFRSGISGFLFSAAHRPHRRRPRRAPSCGTSLLEADGFVVVGESATGTEGLDAVIRLAPIWCCSTWASRTSTGSGSERLKACPDSPAVVLTSSRDRSDYPPHLEDCGARGFIAKAELSGPAWPPWPPERGHAEVMKKRPEVVDFRPDVGIKSAAVRIVTTRRGRQIAGNPQGCYPRPGLRWSRSQLPPARGTPHHRLTRASNTSSTARPRARTRRSTSGPTPAAPPPTRPRPGARRSTRPRARSASAPRRSGPTGTRQAVQRRRVPDPLPDRGHADRDAERRRHGPRPRFRYTGADTNAVLAQKPTGFNFEACGGALPICNKTTPGASTSYDWAGAPGRSRPRASTPAATARARPRPASTTSTAPTASR